MSDDLRVNGNLVSWGSHIHKVDGARWFGITAIDWNEKRERSYGYGMNRAHAPIGRTGGKYTPGPVKITYHKHTWIKMVEYLKSKAPDGVSIGNVSVHMMLQIEEGSISNDVEFLDCVLAEKNPKAEENPDPNMIDIVWNSMGITDDDSTLFDATEGA